MKSFYPMMLLCFSIRCVWAQQEPAEFGDVSMQELKMKNYPQDTSAIAVILFDQGDNQVGQGLGIGTVFKRHVRIKIFKKQAYKVWGNVSMLTPRSSVSRLKGASYFLENGKIVESEVSNNAIFRSQEGKYLEQIDFAFPNVKEGSVVEYSYAISKIGQVYMPSWPLQNTIPTIWSEYTLNFAGSGFTTDVRGSLKITKHVSKNDGQYQRWVMINSPAFKSEPLMPHPGIYQSVINFWNLQNSWLDVVEKLQDTEDFMAISKKNIFLEEKVEKLTKGIIDPREKIRTISSHIKQNIAWDGTNDFLAEGPKLVFEQGKGSSGDINLLLASMLTKAGFSVDMVMISTRSHGFILEEYPSLKQFDYLVCRVLLGSTELLLDATEKYLPFDILPERCLNQRGLLVNSKSPGWIIINSKAKAKTTVDAALNLAPNGDFHGKLVFTMEGYDALAARRQLRDGGDMEMKDSLIRKSWQIEHQQIENLKEFDRPVKETYDVHISNQTTLAADLMYVNPFVALKDEPNPFIPATREYPIDFETLREKVLVCTISLPEGYDVEEIPQSKVIQLKDNAAKCTFHFSQTGNRIFVMSSLQINKTFFVPEEYPDLREFYTRFVAKMKEQIVLRKKK